MPNRLWLAVPSVVFGWLRPQPVSRPACASSRSAGTPTARAAASANGRILSTKLRTFAGTLGVATSPADADAVVAACVAEARATRALTMDADLACVEADTAPPASGRVAGAPMPSAAPADAAPPAFAASAVSPAAI